jgi:hypothetical protein
VAPGEAWRVLKQRGRWLVADLVRPRPARIAWDVLDRQSLLAALDRHDVQELVSRSHIPHARVRTHDGIQWPIQAVKRGDGS